MILSFKILIEAPERQNENFIEDNSSETGYYESYQLSPQKGFPSEDHWEDPD